MKYPLNTAQKQAVEYTVGPLLIVAGAGTGKTTVITQKIAYLIENKLATPEQILALTFTDKAAGEMQDRVDELVSLGYTEIQISTFHAFCQRLLENHGLDIGLPNQFKLLTPTDAWMMVRKNFNKFDLNYYRPLGNPAKHIHELLKHFSKCKDELITPREYLDYAEAQKLDRDSSTPLRFIQNDNKKDDEEIDVARLTEVANAYHVYNQLLLDNNALDFGDLIYYTIKLLRERPNILNILQKKYKFILVDEFQDVNWAQYQLVQMIAGDHGQLTVVGDDDQSIYAFRGASVSNIMRFKEDYPEAKEIVLIENYRSRQQILDKAYESVQNNNPDRLEVKLKIDKRLIACNNKQRSKDGVEGNAVCHIHSDTLENEAREVVAEIIRLKSIDPDSVWDDFAILVRANSHAEPFISRLEAVKIPYEFLASAGLYRQPIVLDCVNFLKLIDNYHESSAVYRLLAAPFWHFSERDLQLVTNYAKKRSVSYYEVLRQAGAVKLADDGQSIANKLLELISVGAQSARVEKPSTVLYQFLSASGYLEYLTKEENAGHRQVIRQIYQLKQFFDYLQKFEAQNIDGASVVNFLDHYQMVIDSGEKGELYMPNDTPDSVNIMTAHASKGLEFKYVFVVNLVEDRFPSRDRSEAIEIPLDLVKEQLPEGDSHLQEERRLFYVAMTRAKEKLYLTSASDYGGARAKKISRFLNEIGYSSDSKKVKNKIETKIITPITRSNDDREGEIAYELPSAFSFSQVKAYDTCPYQYKLSNILHIPTRGSASFSFGQTIHGTLQEFYIRVQQLNSAQQNSLFDQSVAKEMPVSGGVKTPSLDELLMIYESKWIPDWYQDKFQREKYFDEGKKLLRTFFKNNESNWTIPARLEGWFNIKIQGHSLRGRIDRIDQLPDGTLEIVDYKTGKSKEKLAADDKDQLLLYQIATSQLPEYHHLGKVTKLTFYYVNDDVKLSFIGSEKEIIKIESKIATIIEKIQTRDFKATPGEHVCKHCDFRDICEFKR
jgi:DNA helicase-2/ATP-dependent DNA helicase PcrA